MGEGYTWTSDHETVRPLSKAAWDTFRDSTDPLIQELVRNCTLSMSAKAEASGSQGSAGGETAGVVRLAQTPTQPDRDIDICGMTATAEKFKLLEAAIQEARAMADPAAEAAAAAAAIALYVPFVPQAGKGSGKATSAPRTAEAPYKQAS